MKRFLAVLLVLMMLIAVCSCDKNDTNETTEESSKQSVATTKEESVKTKAFTKKNMTITLPENFKETTVQGYTVCYESNDAWVLALREAFSLEQGFSNWTLDQYADVIRTNSAANSPTQISHENDLTSIEHSFFNEDENLTYKYFVAVYKSSDAFWMIQFSCTEDNYDAYRASFIEWAKSVEFSA